MKNTGWFKVVSAKVIRRYDGVKRRGVITGAAVGVTAALTDIAVASAVMMNIGKILRSAGEERAAEIFSALGRARINGSAIVFVLTALVVGLSVLTLFRWKRTAVCVVLIVAACAVGFVGTLLCLRVNGVPVYTAVGVILDIAASGLL